MGKRILAILLVIAMIFTGCSKNTSDDNQKVRNLDDIQSNHNDNQELVDLDDGNKTDINTSEGTDKAAPSELKEYAVESREEYAKSLDFDGLNDDDLLRYVKDNIYDELVKEIGDSDYYIENIETRYISKEYIEELEYNSKVNIFFGYTLAELEEQFQGKRYIFTLSEDGKTIAVPFEGYDNTFNKVLKNVAIGTGVILICVTVSAVTAGAGAPAVSMIFAASAKTATTMAVSSGIISGVAAGVVEGVKTGDMDAALKAGALAGSEGFMWGAITGAVAGGAGEAIALKGATANGLTMNQVAAIQKESGYPLDVIKGFKNMEQYQICKEANLVPRMIDGKMALVRNIDLNYVSESGLTNLQLMQSGKAAIDPATNLPYELHHIGQEMDSTLAILSKAEHMQGGNNTIWHVLGEESKIDRQVFAKQKAAFWKAMASLAG